MFVEVVFEYGLGVVDVFFGWLIDEYDGVVLMVFYCGEMMCCVYY